MNFIVPRSTFFIYFLLQAHMAQLRRCDAAEFAASQRYRSAMKKSDFLCAYFG